VLDVGCGTGTLLEAAVRAGADPVGVDVAPPMVDAARTRAPTAVVVAADAQTTDLLEVAPGSPFDQVVSRFGVMFFEDPGAAFANIRSACAPGARLSFVCWRAEETEMFQLGLRSLLAHMAEPPTLAPPDVPGPLGLANADRTRDLLLTAGWSDVAIEALDGLCEYALEASDGVEERLAMALSSSMGRAAKLELEPRLGPEGWESLLDEARAEIRTDAGGIPIRFVGHTWLVTATNSA
jgi:SAM-dependent methyltransferase